MSRFGRSWLPVLVIVTAIAMIPSLVMAGVPGPGTGELRRFPVPTAPPLPFNVAPTPLPHAVQSTAAGRHLVTLSPAAGVRHPAAMSVSRALSSIGNRRRPASASGGTIVLTGSSFTYNVYDATLSYNNFNYLQCAGMRPNSTYVYEVFPPDGSSWQSSAYSTDGNGTCNGWLSLYFGTPFDPTPNPGTTAAFSGVWTFVMKNTTTGSYDSVVYIVVLASQHFSTFADAGLLHPAVDFQPGGNLYVNATGLNTAHQYAIGWVYTGAASLPCVYSIPTSSITKPGTCFVSGSTPGTAVPTGQFTAGWPIPANAAPGTYTVQLFDATTNDVVGTQQISVEPATLSWTLTPYNTSLGNGTNNGSIFATDGYIDASVTGISYAVTGLPAATNGDPVALTISDPNGMVLNNAAAGFAPAGTPYTATQSAGALMFNQIAFPANASLQEAFGPTVTPFAPNVLTAQLYDTTTGTVLGSKSFTILGYQGSLAWTNPATNVLTGTTFGTTAQVTVSNSAGSQFGAWNADGISGVKLSNDGQGEQLSLPGGNTTVIDSAGNVWDVTYVGGAGTVVNVTPDPSNPTATLNGSTTVSFTIVVSLTSGSVCKSAPCNVQSSILPQHGIAYSGYDNTSNSMLVLQQGAVYSGVATQQWQVTKGPAPIGNPRYNQGMYVANTGGTGSGGSYTLTLTVANTGPNETLNDLAVTFPASYDATMSTPTLQSATISGVNQSGWRIWTQANNGSLTSSQIELQCGSGCAGVKFNKTIVFTMNFPMFQIPFGYQSIKGTADFDSPGGFAPYTLNTTGTTTNSIVGATNIDSAELAVYSLNPTTMTAVFSPGTIPATLASTTALDFTNTSTASSPFPDYIDQINLSIPNGVIPTSITVPSGWYVQQISAGPPATYAVQVCPIGSAKPCASTYEANALAPGAMLPITFNYSASPFPAAGTYSIAWTAVGANGGATTSPSQNAALIVSPTSAQISFTNVGGYVGPLPPSSNPTPVPGSSQPQVGTDTSYAGGSSFLYKVTNNGTNTITTVNIVVPGQTRAFTNGTDTSGTNWTFTTAPYINGTGAASAGTCSGSLNAANYANATTGGANGTITLTGCSIGSGQYVNVYFNAHTPYDVGSYFDWPATVTSIGAGGGTVNGTPPYAGADSAQIVLNAQMNIITP
ncbi:hypothetical protein EPN42_09335, partial [bacterium]